MTQQLNVNLAFTADTSQAQANLNALKTSLNSISSMTSMPNYMPMTDSIRKASAAAKELQGHITAAFNTTTGNIDLSKFQASLKASNQSLSSLSTQLLYAGDAGEKSFLQLHRALANANLQLTQTQTKMSQLMTTLQNTVKWQISSMAIHKFIGAIQSAYGYSQDLNESLNNIRIVTSNSVEQMAKFAEQANKAAKALSTTTTEYTNASLIYFQQGIVRFFRGKSLIFSWTK